MKSRFVILGVCFAVHASIVIAQPDQTTPENAVVVTATRTARTADQSLASVTVFTREDIERSQSNSLPELLRALPGIGFTSTGGYGKTSALYLRGANPGHVLLLIDGVKAGSATSGAPAWEFLPIAEIDRIEIVRGPRSSLYGSEAIGGVVQIFTKRGEGTVKPTAKTMIGSHDTYEFNAGVSGAPDSTWFNVHAGKFSTNGINATRTSSSTFDPDSDGYENVYGSARVGYRWARETEAEVYLLRARGNSEYDSFTGASNETNFRQNTGGARVQSRIVSWWNTSVHAGTSEDKSYNFRDDGLASTSRFNTKRRVLSWQNDISLDDRQLLTAGFDRQEELVDSTANLTRSSRENDALFGLYQANVNAHSFQASWRSDDNEQFGRHRTGGIAYGYTLQGGARWFGSYGTAFRAPTFVDLYWPDPFFSTGNPNLKPEESRSVEVGVSGKSGTIGWSTSLFRTRIENLIVLTGPTFLPNNVSRATINGAELTGTSTVGAWEFAGNVTLLDPRDDETDRYLQRRSRYATRFDADRRFNKTRLGASLIVEGKRYSDPANQMRLNGFALIDLRAEQALTSDWRLAARVENALDEDYQTVSGFNHLGRSVFLTLSYQPANKQ